MTKLDIDEMALKYQQEFILLFLIITSNAVIIAALVIDPN